MKSFNEELLILEENLQEFLDKSEKILDSKSGINETLQNLFILNTKESISLANDIIATQDDIKEIETYYNKLEDNPFNYLYDEDSEL
mgnify:CR=1 FL=1